jgi:hypothetical protein
MSFSNLIVLQNLLSEFHTDAQNSSKTTLLREILSDHYHPFSQVSIHENRAAILVCVAKESIEVIISQNSLVRDIVWKYYGYDDSPVKNVNSLRNNAVGGAT